MLFERFPMLARRHLLRASSSCMPLHGPDVIRVLGIINSDRQRRRRQRILCRSHSSTPNQATDDGIAVCASDLYDIGGGRTGSGPASKNSVSDAMTMAMEVARELSPSARNEISAARRKVAQKMTSDSPSTAEKETGSKEPSREVPEPSKKNLRLVALNQAVPFVGFGFMDNFILIVAGEAIDMSLGVMLGISTMCAAALGNIVSDIAGVLCGTVIEDYCAKIGLPIPNITQAQRQLRSVRFAGQFGCALGLTVGCIIGMVPLLWIDSRSVELKKRHTLMEHIFQDVVTEAKDLIGAEVMSVFFVMDADSPTNEDKDCKGMKGKYLWAKYADGVIHRDNVKRIPLGRNIKTRVVETGELVNLIDARKDPDFAGDQAVLGDATRSLLCVPVYDSDGDVIAVLQAVNKVPSGRAAVGAVGEQAFTIGDMQVLQALASHLSVYLSNANAEEKMSRFSETIHVLRRSTVKPRIAAV